MKFPKNIKNVFRKVVGETKVQLTKLDGIFVVENPNRITVIIPLGAAGKDFLTNKKNKHRKALTERYGKHTVTKLSEVLYRVDRS